MLFQTKSGSFNYTKNNGRISNWLSTGMHNESGIDLVGVVNSSSTLLQLFNSGNRLDVPFTGNYFKQDKIDYFHGVVINIYIVYDLQ